jgi:hypothetical protein
LKSVLMPIDLVSKVYVIPNTSLKLRPFLTYK